MSETKTVKKSTLLVDGAAAFEEILRCIDNARSSVSINMFIWREDNIGVRLAGAVLQAAQRGVKVSISVDRVGMILERAEESGRSFFHRKPGAIESFKIAFLRVFYPRNCGKREEKCICPGLLEKLMAHPNITVERDRKKNDHSKYYIIDGQILIFGGINVEDKECGADYSGRVYQDYMLKLEGEEYVRAFLDKLERDVDTGDGYRFRMNKKSQAKKVFEMEESFLSVINGANRELVIVMAYFAPIPSILDAIVCAWKRGVCISIMIPECANFQNNSNRKTVSILMKRCQNDICVMLSPKMIHTKLISSERVTMLGSCNITNLAFTELCELDIELENKKIPITSHIMESVAENFALSRRITDYRSIRYSPIIAWLEGRVN